MPEHKDFQRLRRDLSVDEDELDDVVAEALFEEAAETYSGVASVAAYARVLAIQGMIADAKNEVDYTQSESSEKSNQVMKNLLDMLALWQGNLRVALANEATSNSAGARVPPTHTVRVYPTW